MSESVFSAARRAQTTMPCKSCGRPVIIARTCHEVHLHCEECRIDYPARDYVAQMDDAMESFMEGLQCNRI